MRFLAQNAKVERAAQIFARRRRPFGKFREAKQVLGFMLKIGGTDLLGSARLGCDSEKDSQDSKYERTSYGFHQLGVSRNVATRGISGKRKGMIMKDVLSCIGENATSRACTCAIRGRCSKMKRRSTIPRASPELARARLCYTARLVDF